jgi:hypothetical protein
MMNLPFSLRKGRVLGRDHARWGKNCQDGCAFKRSVVLDKEYLIGAVADGCGQGEYNEVAGIMTVTFAVNQIEHLLHFETPAAQIPIALYPSVIGFFETIRKQIPFKSPAEIIGFIQNYLLSTLIAFVIGEEEGVIFYAGDGFIMINDKIHRLEYENQSPYPGYHLVPRSVLQGGFSELPRTFEVLSVEIAQLERLAIATDGFSEELLTRMWQEVRPVPLGIQLWMQWVNGPRNPDMEAGLFYDDAAVIALERVEETEDA